MSPRQFLAHLDLTRERKNRERGEVLYIGLLAARGEQKALQRQMKAWSPQERPLDDDLMVAMPDVSKMPPGFAERLAKMKPVRVKTSAMKRGR